MQNKSEIVIEILCLHASSQSNGRLNGRLSDLVTSGPVTVLCDRALQMNGSVLASLHI